MQALMHKAICMSLSVPEFSPRTGSAHAQRMQTFHPHNVCREDSWNVFMAEGGEHRGQPSKRRPAGHIDVGHGDPGRCNEAGGENLEETAPWSSKGSSPLSGSRRLDPAEGIHPHPHAAPAILPLRPASSFQNPAALNREAYSHTCNFSHGWATTPMELTAAP
jgi:hypothetical protein